VLCKITQFSSKVRAVVKKRKVFSQLFAFTDYTFLVSSSKQNADESMRVTWLSKNLINFHWFFGFFRFLVNFVERILITLYSTQQGKNQPEDLKGWSARQVSIMLRYPSFYSCCF
jgi:hypothetical protein